MPEPIDILLERLYSSNDPDCYEAALIIEKQNKKIAVLDNKITDISLAAKYMMESLIEITHLSKERDKPRNIDPKKLSRELDLRLRECGNIANDTIKLNSVKLAYNRMYNE